MARTGTSAPKKKAKAKAAVKPKAKAKPAPKAKAKAKPKAKAPAKPKAKSPAKPKAKAPAKAAPKKKKKATAAATPKAKLVKILLHASGEDPETPWATDLGPAPGVRGGRRVRLDNVPFLHAKPTYGDEIVVVPGSDGFLEWDRADGDPDRGDRIARDGGRYALIIDYQPEGGDAKPVFEAICAAARSRDVVPEGCFGPRDGKPGRAYFAAPNTITPPMLMNLLVGGVPDCAFTLIHPE